MIAPTFGATFGILVLVVFLLFSRDPFNPFGLLFAGMAAAFAFATGYLLDQVLDLSYLDKEREPE